MSGSARVPLPRSAEPAGIRAVLRLRDFRRLWIGLGLSSLGDWLGLLAITAMASMLAPHSYSGQNYAIGGVLLLRVLPAVVLGPVAGYLADRLDRRWNLVVGDVVRAALFVSIPLVGTLLWLMVATVLVEAVSLIWLPAKDATIPNLVPADRLEAANQLSIATTYGSALPAAALFVLLSLISRAVDATVRGGGAPATIALYANAATFLVSGLVIASLRDIPPGPALADGDRAGVLKVIVDGWSYVFRTPLIRGLTLGIVGAFAAGGVVIGLARVYVADLGGGDPGYGLLFGCVFAGMAAGMLRGPRVLPTLGRRQLFGLALTAAGSTLAAIALVANLVVVAMLAVVLGACAGTAWILGYTMLGLEVTDALRGRTFAFVQTLIRLVLSLVLAVGPLIAGTIGRHRFRVTDDSVLDYNGAAMTMFAAAVLLIGVGLRAYHLMDDRPSANRHGVPPSMRRGVKPSVRRHRPAYAESGLFVAFEGGDGAGKSTQAQLLAEALSAAGCDVVLTSEPGASVVGSRIRAIVLDPATGQLDDRAETLLYAADKAEHVTKVIRPALDRGAVVITDRYVDSTLAYQGAGRALDSGEVAEVARWATGDLRPHLTILLDIRPEHGRGRYGEADRLESEPAAFHDRVRDEFLRIAVDDPGHYLVLDARSNPDVIHRAVLDRISPLIADAAVGSDQDGTRVGSDETAT